MIIYNTETLKRIIDMVEKRTDCGNFCPWGRSQSNYEFMAYNGRKRALGQYPYPHCISCWTVMGVPFPSDKVYNPDWREEYLRVQCPCEYYKHDWDQVLLRIIKARKHYGV